jgi:hypothetical protein
MEFFHINRWWRFRLAFAENPGSPFEELIPPGLDDIRVDIELGGQLGQCLFALHNRKRHLRLEGRAVVPAGSSAHHSLLSSVSCRFQAEIPRIIGVQFPRATSVLINGIFLWYIFRFSFN